MEWSIQQEQALRDVERWIANPDSKTYELFGVAGSGKSTLANYLAANVRGMVLFAAYTGKAAHVLRRKGCANATTIHKLMYRPSGETAESPELIAARATCADLENVIAAIVAKGDVPPVAIQVDMAGAHDRLAFLERREPRKRPLFSLNEDTEARQASLIILDECSMVDERMGIDLESLGVPIIVLGDPAQLPPVGGGGYFTNRQPRTLLTEIHRQARESGILRAATDVREGRSLSPGQYGEDCLVIRKGDDRSEQLARDADQILVGRNKTRHASNSKMRKLLQLGDGSPFPVGGDKLVCLRNNHHEGLLNGSTWRVHEARNDSGIMTGVFSISSIEDPDVAATETVAWLHHFNGQEHEIARMGWARRDANEFDFSYAMTVHKAQGSGFDDVYLYDESSSFGKDARAHLYTGITRAAKSLTIVLT